ncbi:MAG: hypothetical protein COV35_07815 [Alphaproteobacteria bacterium CG11_big_fil_rev_8_21_14_0_20_39_49]|nr:MAG: hypothetical protein COV35_07815 [Alphaproteobacteria bacterium CG11_big_fil_rev_8_21_14_0_20_39_49]
MKSKGRKSKQDQFINPEEQKVSRLQAQRLSHLSGVDVKDIKGTIAQVADSLKWRIDPELFLFRKVCGKVVKKDPDTGIEYPVPFATVHVEDTDCDLITYFPIGWQWSWHFPINCKREVIATVQTDECGNFCVWIPRFDIDWVLKWRKERICFPTIFRRPSLGDLLPKIPDDIVDGPWPPIPLPDPGPLKEIQRFNPSVIEAIAGNAAGRLATKINDLQESKALGANNSLASNRAIQTRAFEHEMQPPLPREFHDVLSGQNLVASKKASPVEAIRSYIARELDIDVKEIIEFDPSRFIGPFYRCFDIYLPTWQKINDVPDITFRVTQDVDGDGDEELIYSEGYFDVRWDENPISDVTLYASSIAKESNICGVPVVPCGNVPAILFAGFMPLTLPAYYDNTNGYTIRPNRPKTGSPVRPAAQTPFCNNVQLYGCVDIQNAKYYRILRSVDNGGTFSAITGISWNNYKDTGGSPILIHADSNGWYPVHPVDSGGNTVNREDLAFENLLMDWPTPTLGKSILRLEIGNASKSNISFSADVAVQTDNTAPEVTFTKLAWKFVGESDSALRNLLGVPCPTIHRGSVPKSIELVFQVSVAANHLRDAYLSTSDCGGGAFTPIADVANNPEHWHISVLDNTEMLYQRYRLDSSALEGSYSFICRANSRAMNPSGDDGGNNVPPDWFYDPIEKYRKPSIGVAVVDVD